MSDIETAAKPWVDRLRTLAPAMMTASPYANALGARLVEVEPGRALLSLPWAEALVGDPETGVIAGGVVTALLDQTCGYAVWSALEEFSPIATLDLRIDYMRPARTREPLQARAECYKLGRAIAFVRGLAFEADPSDPIAAAQGVFVLTGKAGARAELARRSGGRVSATEAEDRRAGDQE